MIAYKNEKANAFQSHRFGIINKINKQYKTNHLGTLYLTSIVNIKPFDNDEFNINVCTIIYKVLFEIENSPFKLNEKISVEMYWKKNTSNYHTVDFILDRIVLSLPRFDFAAAGLIIEERPILEEHIIISKDNLLKELKRKEYKQD